MCFVLSVLELHVLAVERASTEQEGVQSFEAFTQKLGRVYEGGLPEYEERRALFESRVVKVHHQNSQPERRWTAGINAFSDRTTAELSQLRGWRRRGSPAELAQHGDSLGRLHRSSQDGSLSLRQKERATPQEAAPESVSWAFLKAVKRHYDQGSCGSCWAIASAVLLEAHSEIHSAEGEGRTFSAQELVSCVANPKHCGGTGGCEGATIELAMDWVIKHGLADEAAVPYQAIDGECSAEKQAEGSSLLQIRGNSSTRSTVPLEESVVGATGPVHDMQMPGAQFGMMSWERLPENEYSALLHAVQDGPVGISVAASNWFEYSSGVFDNCAQDSVIDHAVVLIGYGQEKGAKDGDGYWLIKNSWGPEWGEDGIMRLMRRGGKAEGSYCGVDKQPQLGSGCDGGPSEVTVCGTCGILYDTVVPHWQGSSEKMKAKSRAAE